MAHTKDTKNEDNYSFTEMVVAAVIIIVICAAGWLIFNLVKSDDGLSTERGVVEFDANKYNFSKKTTFTAEKYGFQFTYPSFWFDKAKLGVREVPEYEREAGKAYAIGIKGYPKYAGGFITRDWQQTRQQTIDNAPLGFTQYTGCKTLQQKDTTVVTLLDEDGVCAKLYGNVDPANGAGMYFVVEKRLDNNSTAGSLYFISQPVTIEKNTEAAIKKVYTTKARQAVIDFAKSIKELPTPDPATQES